MKVIVYVRSNSIVLGRQKHSNIQFHGGGGGCNQHSTYLIEDAVEDRLLEPDSMEIAQAAKRLHGEVQFVDVGFWEGRLRAILSGVWKIPTVVVYGEKHSGEVKARRALAKLAS